MKYILFSFLFITITAFAQIKDFDGNTYHFIKLDGKYWSTEELRTTHFSNGDKITYATNDSLWNLFIEKKIPAYCHVMDNKSLEIRYNYYAIIDKRGLVPKNCKIPDSTDYKGLIKSLGGVSEANLNKLRSTEGWEYNLMKLNGEYIKDDNGKYIRVDGNGTNETGLNLKSTLVYWCQGWANDNIAYSWLRGGKSKIKISYEKIVIDTSPNYIDCWALPVVRFIKIK
jgi:uncharacterized protein (TIGR02145 family)